MWECLTDEIQADTVAISRGWDLETVVSVVLILWALIQPTDRQNSR